MKMCFNVQSNGLHRARHRLAPTSISPYIFICRGEAMEVVSKLSEKEGWRKVDKKRFCCYNIYNNDKKYL
jgi:hypothetical protein